MLTILAPIEIKAKSKYIRDPESFYHRIVGNYSLMETHIDQEDLLHLSATPPEIYVQEGDGMTSILSRNQRNETNLQKVEILNNVINRIVVSADTELSYQDRVFITDALYKLGIRDERHFMKAFYQMAEETKNTNTLINLYLERGGELRELIESVETDTLRERTSETQRLEKERENFLYSQVMKRLQTGAIYQIVSNFNRSVEENEIDSREYSLANQSYTAQHILLSMLRERSGISSDNLLFLDQSTYEENIEGDEISRSHVRNELTRAVLMDILKNIYHTGYDRFYTNNETFYRFEDTFFKSSDQTFLRLINNTSDILESYRETQEIFNQTSELTSSEIELLEKSDGEQITDEELINITKTINAINVQNEERRRRYESTLRQLTVEENRGSARDQLERTRKDAVLALTDPEALKEKLQEREVVRERMRNQVLQQMQTLFPDSNAEIYHLINEYYQGNTELITNNIVRPADVGELIYDINAAQYQEEAVDRAQKIKDRETEQFMEALKKAHEQEQQKVKKTGWDSAPVETIHRRSQALTEEELDEQINQLQKNISRQINKEVESSVVNEQHVTHTTTIETKDTNEKQLSTYEINKLIENGVRNQMNTISNQVIGKLERQMRNEKARRGYI